MIFPSNKIRVEIVLPLYYNDKTQIEPGKFPETRRGDWNRRELFTDSPFHDCHFYALLTPDAFCKGVSLLYLR
jgi:hypothetical protein